ncbi:MAG TPA: efflux RND transporter periplasmic adaptor subunit [Steroidobacteraceae bacterium]|nr:efflux RND transporter periplasmic adaptor subunit [Steroidobacteraceae bacterium]
MDAPATAASPVTRLLRRRRQTWLGVLGVALVVVALGAAAWWFLYASRYQSTDDAYVAGDLVNVNSQVSGTVISIGADDTDRVQAGQELVRFDATDARIALREAEEQLARAVRQVHTVFANRDQLAAIVAQRRADLDRARADLGRRRGLATSGAVSAEELGHAQDAVRDARDALTAAQKSLAASLALVGHTGVADNPEVRLAATQVEHAWLNFERTRVRAPVSGYVARRTVQLGERITPGTPLMAIVPLERVWIEANFKEVQLERMRIGQPVRVSADLYGGGVEYHGRVEGLGMGTGAAFALLPAQNATGNWIKVVQRVPVRIALEPADLERHPLRIGLSMRVRVDVQNDSGRQLAAEPRAAPVLATRAYDVDAAAIRTRIEEIIRANDAAGRAPGAAAEQ